VLPPQPIRSAIDILIVTTIALVWTVTNSKLSWGLGVLRNANSHRIRSAMQASVRQKPPNSRIPYFHPSKCRPCTVPPGSHAPISPLPAATGDGRVEKASISIAFHWPKRSNLCDGCLDTAACLVLNFLMAVVGFVDKIVIVEN